MSGRTPCAPKLSLIGPEPRRHYQRSADRRVSAAGKYAVAAPEHCDRPGIICAAIALQQYRQLPICLGTPSVQTRVLGDRKFTGCDGRQQQRRGMQRAQRARNQRCQMYIPMSLKWTGRHSDASSSETCLPLSDEPASTSKSLCWRLRYCSAYTWCYSVAPPILAQHEWTWAATYLLPVF